MKRFLTAVLFCASLLAVLSQFLFPVTSAAENPLIALINLPAPPPPNPHVTLSPVESDPEFFSKSKQPPDDAPISSLMDYWRIQSSNYRELGYNPRPSDKVIDRLLAEVQKDPERVHEFLNAFRGSKKAAEVVKEIHDRSRAGNEAERNRRSELRRWLTYNSAYFSTDLARLAARVADVNEYVSNQEELLSLGRVDWERARPIVDRLYSGNQKVSRVLAQWALYRNALDNNSLSDIERYREELKKVVEDKTATDGMRDLAFDALVKEKEWEGRDEWYYSLLSDETLDDLRVGGTTYTGLTTIMYYSPDERYIDKMVELVKSDNKAVRTAAAKNLLKRLNANNPDVIRALLPWVQDPKWLNGEDGQRNQIVSALQNIKLPESVPVLIAALDEKAEQRIPVYGGGSSANAMNAASNAATTVARAAAMAANMPANAAHVDGPMTWRTQLYYPLRSSAINALGFQEDARAVAPLKRLLGGVEAPFEIPMLVSAIYRCGGFTLAEQVDAIEEVAKSNDSLAYATNAMSNDAYAYANAVVRKVYSPYPLYSTGSDGRPTLDVKRILGGQLAQEYEVKDDLARAVVERITSLDRSDAKTANALRRIVMRWHAPAINTLFLNDLKTNKATSESIVRLLGVRSELREKQMSSLFEVRTGSQTAVGISACLLEDPNDYEAILDGDSAEAKTALLACGRLVRAQLPVKKVAGLLQSKDPLLVNAAERYLESEDSVAARQIVLSRHPNESKILGATTAFFDNSDFAGAGDPGLLQALFASVSPYYKLPNAYVTVPEYLRQQTEETEKRIQDELKKDPSLLGVYNWESNYIHIYKERAVVSWHDDPARYRERTLTPEEFDNFKGLIAHFKADELPPFLSCAACTSQQLLMVGRNGGRRVFVKTTSLPAFFAELDRTFSDLRMPPSAIKYWAGKDVPGLEVLFADDRLEAMSVFKNGSDFRLLTADKVQRVEIDNQLEEFAEGVDEDEETGEDSPEQSERIEAERSRREYENYAWQTFSAGALSGPTTQPTEVPYIPSKDSFKVPAEDGQWKARAGTVEIRVSDEGLFKISAGKFTQIKTGNYHDPVVTPNGRWVIATKYDDESGPRLVRINLTTNRELAIEPGELPTFRAIAYVPSVNRVLLGPYRDEYYEYDGVEDGDDGEDESRTQYSWLDPETGSVVAARGEVRPIAQQEWRALQPAAGQFEFWAAIPRSKETIVGIYNARTFAFKTLVTLPKIKFDSCDMWVDAAESKAYFVYEGHLLAMPLKPTR